MRLEEKAKIKGSARLDAKWSRVFVVVLAEGERMFRRRDHSSPTNTSRARVAAKSVRSRVRPAWGLGVWSGLGEARGVAAVVSVVVDGMLCLDWSSRRLNHAAMKEERYLDNLSRDQSVWTCNRTNMSWRNGLFRLGLPGPCCFCETLQDTSKCLAKGGLPGGLLVSVQQGNKSISRLK